MVTGAAGDGACAAAAAVRLRQQLLGLLARCFCRRGGRRYCSGAENGCDDSDGGDKAVSKYICARARSRHT